MSQQAKAFCFTINNPTNDDLSQIEDLSTDERVEYLIVGNEVGEQGTPHIQGFVLFKNKIRWTTVKNILTRAFLAATKGTTQQNIDYCSKENDFVEYGTRPPQETKHGLDKVLLWIDQFIATHKRAPSAKDFALEQPHAFVRYRNIVQLGELRCPAAILQEGELNEWQQILESVLVNPCPSDRDILFYLDEKGGKGKSWFTRWFATKYPEKCQLMQSSGYADMAYALDETKSVFLINVPRGGIEFLQYRFLESLKDKYVFSSKYESKMKILRETPHIVVFCNEYPDLSKMSSDRYNITNMNPVGSQQVTNFNQE